MDLLIIDDNRQLAELTTELLRKVDRSSRNIGLISIAGDLETALRLLPRHDAVLCDGQFPLSPNFWYRKDQWVGVYNESVELGTLFILHSGDTETVREVQNKGIPAISKPSRIEQLYATLMEHWGARQGAPAECVANR